ncbi:PREDICTED: fibroblast growth factor 2 [Charadrius vociferus]|uniref:fibroblast growth factor 2 n=1 Tax=Charadrius vociferus TaxID=50402 RepID=UPI000521A0F6|nr:PREDICTED: fibroblast growth factor 2 [Charadrius vociferus]
MGLKSPCMENDGKRVTFGRARGAARGRLADTEVNLSLPWAGPRCPLPAPFIIIKPLDQQRRCPTLNLAGFLRHVSRNDRRRELMRSRAAVRAGLPPSRSAPGTARSLKLQLQAEERGVVSIKGVSANRFLAMKEDGRLLALKCATEECFFFERLESNNYNTYRSRKYSDWYVALKRTGQYKPGPKTGPGQKAILFLPMSAKS